MASAPLIDTTNRLLGWSTSDFSLYGGQAAVTIGAPATFPQHSDALTVPDPAAASRSADPQVPLARAEAIEAAVQPHDAPLGGVHFTPFIPAPIQFGDPTHPQGFDAAVPAATGSGTPVLPMEALHAPAIVPAGFTPPVLAVEQPATEAPALASFAGLTAPVLEAGETLDHAISTITATTDSLLGDMRDAIDALPSVSDILTDTDTVSATDEFLGSDPIAGVATLVSMVDSTDAFDLAHAGLDVPDVAASVSTLDALADDAPSLLGDVAHDADTIIPDHHHDGVLGLL